MNGSKGQGCGNGDWQSQLLATLRGALVRVHTTLAYRWQTVSIKINGVDAFVPQGRAQSIQAKTGKRRPARPC